MAGALEDTTAMSAFQSAQHFIRALKGPADPPIAGGPTKIEIAEQAWNGSSFHLPNKAEVVSEWLLTKFTKERGAGFSSNPLADERHWKLLCSVLISSAEPNGNAPTASSHPYAWLKPLMGRISILPIVTSFLGLWEQLDVTRSAQLLRYASRTLSILYPIGTQKLTTEALLEAWGSFLKNSPDFIGDASAIRIGSVLTKAYADSLSNNTNRKKVNSNFVQNTAFFEAWLKCIDATSPSSHYDYLRQSILSAGVETIFNVDTIRQMAEAPEGTPLSNALNAAHGSIRPTVLKTLPKLLAQYTTALRRHKGAIVTQGSSTQTGSSRTETNAASMRFYALCLNILDTDRRDELAWNTVSDLTEIVSLETLYDPRSDLAFPLSKNVSTALEYLHECPQGETTTAIARCLSAIVRVDYDLVLPSTGQILTRLLAIPQSHPDHFAFLDLLLEYHIKTRTVNQYIETLLACLTVSPVPAHLTPQARYSTSLSSPVLHPRHLEKLSKATQQFLTPSQCNGTVELICETLKTLREKHKASERAGDAAAGKGSKKARKSDAAAMVVDDPQGASEPGVVALSFILSARLAQTVLGSLPLASVPQAQAEELRGMVSAFSTEFVEHNLSKLLKSLSGGSEDEEGGEFSPKGSKKRKSGVLDEGSWSVQVVVAALLKLRYALGMVKDLPPQEEASKLSKRLLALSSMDEDHFLLPELSLEIVRALLDQAFTLENESALSAIDYTLKFIEKRLAPHKGTTWSGFAHELSFGESGRAKSGLAALHLVLERWLPVVDVVASENQLKQLAQLISQMPLTLDGSNRTQELTSSHLLFRTLRSAQFWELHNLRSAVLSRLEESTGLLDLNDRTSPKKPSKRSSKRRQSTGTSSSFSGEVVSTFRLLLFFPIEYLTKASRAVFVKRAIAADWSLAQQVKGDDHSVVEEEAFAGLTVIRTFLKRAFGFLGSIEQQTSGDVADFALHLLEDVAPPNGPANTEYTQMTLELCEQYFAELFKQTIRADAGEASKVLDSYLQYPIFDALSSIKAKSLVSLVKLLEKEFTFASFPAEVQESFQTLHSRLIAVLESKLRDVLGADSAERNLPDLLAYWHTLLSLGRWIGLESSSLFGTQLVQRLNANSLLSKENASEWVDNFCVMTIAILLQELHYRDEMERNEHLDMIVAAYISYRRVLSAPGLAKMDEYLSRSCRQFSPANFEHVLGLVDETLAIGSSAMATDLVHLATVLLRDHPPNSLRIMRSFFTRCLDIFTNNDRFTSGDVELRTRTLDLVAQHCSERPAALRSLDMGSTWLLLSKYLAPSVKHDSTTSTTIFHKICSVVNAIIRLRRDLASPMLPHLGMILRQLILSMRQCRPQLASKQTEMVMSTQPRWIDASSALGVEEAKALTRVLETLTTKTITRVHATSTETQKAESLATPFSKHAAYVLKAYIEAMNDPLCVLTLDVRKELYPGLYALCSMIGEHSRDALMVSGLDAGGKATLKALWKEYEKQRYVGRG